MIQPQRHYTDVLFTNIFMFDSKLTNVFYIDPCYCYDAPKLILSFT